jgi:predicted component of type VI protein secretion system
MFYRLVPTDPKPGEPTRGWKLNLPETIGRNPELAVYIDDESISRSHCQILLGPDESLKVRDLGSLNGTDVNGERIRQIHSLVPGDILQLGSASLRIEYVADADPGPPVRQKSKPVLTATQPMKVLPPQRFTQEQIKDASKRWWEFWKSK